MPAASLHNEKELLQKLAQGDEIAFTRLFYAYKDKLYSFLLHFTGSPASAEDILQEVFLKIWRLRTTFSDFDNFNGYLFQMARNHALNGLRRQSLGAVILAEIGRAANTGTPDAGEILSGKEVQALLQQALDRLPPQQRRVYELGRNQGLKYEEIAAQLNISVSTVRNHMIQALKSIREFVKSAYLPGIVYCALLIAPMI